MLKKIEYIKNFGIYKNYKRNDEMKDFSQYNLFYGWNGSGKSTFSRLLQLLEDKRADDECRFKLNLSNGGSVTEKNFTNFTESVHVFNDEFIKKNIDWDGTIKSILLLSEEKIDEVEELQKQKERFLHGLINHIKTIIN